MIANHHYTPQQLIELMCNGHEAAFKLLFQQYHDKVYKLAFSYLKSSVAAEEISQEVFLKLWLLRNSLSGLHSLEAWLYTVTKNNVLNWLKKESKQTDAIRHLSRELAQSENNTDNKIRHAQYEALVQKAINNLSPQQKTVYRLAKMEGLSYEQIASNLSLSALTVKTHIARALASIRSFLKEEDGLHSN